MMEHHLKSLMDLSCKEWNTMEWNIRGGSCHSQYKKDKVTISSHFRLISSYNGGFRGYNLTQIWFFPSTLPTSRQRQQATTIRCTQRRRN